jgi:hypothetical protein
MVEMLHRVTSSFLTTQTACVRLHDLEATAELQDVQLPGRPWKQWVQVQLVAIAYALLL